MKKCLLVILLLIPIGVLAQTLDLVRSRVCKIDSSSIQIDSLSIIPNTFVLMGLDSSDYHVDYLNAVVHVDNPDLTGLSFNCSYRCFSFNLLHPVRHRSSDLNIRQRGSIYHRMNPITPPAKDIFASDANRLIGTGSIARGVSIGTNQNFVLDATLNLQLSGQLSDKLEIVANITDKNTPIQPEGNTRIIQDFDQVFIRLDYDNRFFLDAGDVELNFKNDHFLYANRRFSGMEFCSDNDLRSKGKDSSSVKMNLKNIAGGGVNKGKFIYVELTAMDGVQGPYRLTGENGESNISVSAGSEMVYMDGQLLTRGEDQDYIIDYNTGEITFTAKNMITQEKRLIVGYEYNDKNYARYNLYTFNEFLHEKNHKLKLNVNVYHEQDLKNHSVQPELDQERKLFLAALPAGYEVGYYPSETPVPYNQNEILYEKRDTLVEGVSHTYYLHSNNMNIQLYRVSFTLVGPGLGDYVLESSSANGRVFRWVAPANGVPQGNYIAFQQLRTPITQDMASVAASYGFSENTGFSTELAVSNYDENNFSKDNKDNVGFAYYLDFFHEKELKKHQNSNSPWLFNTNVNYEFMHKNFHVIDNYREIEFYRDFQVPDVYTYNQHEQRVKMDFGIYNTEIGNVDCIFQSLNRFGNMNAFKNDLVANLSKNSWIFSTQTAYLFSNDSLYKTNYIKTNTSLGHSWKKVQMGVKDIFEYNNARNRQTGSLEINSFGFNEATVFLKNNDSLPYLFQLSYKNRLDNALEDNVMFLGKISNEAQASFELAKLKNNKIKGNVTYRNIQIKNDEGKFNAENCFLGRLEYTGRFFKNAIMLNTYYEAGSGMEQKMVYTYLKVADGKGVYTWVDYNGNGIEELDEFEVAAFQDQANYVKVWQNSNDYVNTFNNQFLQTVQLRPGNVWSNRKDFRRVLARFSNSTTFKTVQKNTLANGNAFNPFYLNVKDSNVVSANLSFINTLSYNHKSLFGIDFTVQSNQTKNMLYYGADICKNDAQQVVLRGNPTRFITLKTDYRHNHKRNHSEFMASRSFNIDAHYSVTDMNLQFRNKYFVQLSYMYFWKKNLYDAQKAIQHKVFVEFKMKMLKKGNLLADVAYINLKYNDDVNSSIAYEMLEGLGIGNNMTWNVKYEANLTEFLQLNLLYQGRVSEGNKAIHTGSLEIRAHF